MNVKIEYMSIGRLGISVRLDKRAAFIWHFIPGGLFQNKSVLFAGIHSVDKVLPLIKAAPLIDETTEIDFSEYLTVETPYSRRRGFRGSYELKRGKTTTAATSIATTYTHI